MAAHRSQPGNQSVLLDFMERGEVLTKQSSAQPILPQLLALLVCPLDKAALRQEGDRLICTQCGRAYPVEDGIPNMLAGESM